MDKDGSIEGERPRRPLAPRTLIVGAAAAVLVVGAGGTALAAALGHRPGVTADGAGGSVFIPFPGAPGGTGAASGNAAAPAPAAGAWSSTGMAPSAPIGAGTAAVASPVYAYSGGCSPQPAQIQGSMVTATGSAQLDVSSIGRSYGLSAGVQDQSASDAGTALRQAQSRIDAIVDALVGAGIPRTAIHSSYYSVSPYPGIPEPGGTRVQGFSVNGNVTATATTLDQLVRGTGAAARAGASSVSVSSSDGYNVAQPPDDRLAAAIAQATASAKRVAAAAASAAGVQLGAVHGLVVAPPAMCGYGAAGPQLTIAVTSAWEVRGGA